MSFYAYIYDNTLVHPRYRQELNRLETRLTDIGLHGSIHRLTTLKNIDELVEEECAQGVKTIVAVGSDTTFHDLISVAAARNIVVGYIPFFSLMPKSVLAQHLNISSQEDAYLTLSQRYIISAPINCLNNKRFMLEATCTLTNPTIIHIDDAYTIVPTSADQHLRIVQQPLLDDALPFLTITLSSQRSQENETIISTKKAVIESPSPLVFTLDGGVSLTTPLARFMPTSTTIRCIAGRSRIAGIH